MSNERSRSTDERQSMGDGRDIHGGRTGGDHLTPPVVPAGGAMHDDIPVPHLADAHLRAGQYLADPGSPRDLRLCSGGGASVLAPAAAFARLSGCEARLLARIDEAKTVLDWQSQHSTVDAPVQDTWNASEEGSPHA